MISDFSSTKIKDLSNLVYFLSAASCLVWIVVTYAPSIAFSAVAVVLATVYFAAAITSLKFLCQKEFVSHPLTHDLKLVNQWTIRVVGLCLPAPAIFYCLYFGYCVLAYDALPQESSGQGLPIDKRLPFLVEQSAKRLPFDKQLLFLASQEESIFGKSVVYDYLESKQSESQVNVADADSQFDKEASAQDHAQSADRKTSVRLPQEASQMPLESESLVKSHPAEDIVRQRLARGKYDSARIYVRTKFPDCVEPSKRAEAAYLEALIDMHKHKNRPSLFGTGGISCDLTQFRPEPEHFFFHDCCVRYEYGQGTWEGPSLKSAACYIKKALAFRPDEPRFLWLESEILQAQGHLVEEMDTLTHLIRVFPCYEAYTRRASFLLNDFSSLSATNGSESEWRLKHVPTEFGSRQILDKLSTAPNREITAHKLANRDALLAAGLQPTNPYVLELVGDTRSGSNLGLELAEQDYGKALKLKSACCEEEQSKLHYKRGQRLRALKKYSLALQELNESLRLKVSPVRLLDRAVVLGHCGQLEAALTDCDSAGAAIAKTSTDSPGFYFDGDGMVDQKSLIQLRGDICFRAAKYREAYREYLRAEALH